MSKNRIKQRRNKKNGRYLKALDRYAASDRSEAAFFTEEIKKTDECGIADLTGYNAVKIIENKEWTLLYR